MLPLPCTTLPETSNLVLSCCKDLFTVHCTIRPSLYLSGLHPPRGRHFDNATYAAREYDGSSSISSPSFLSTFSRYVRSTFRRVVDRSREESEAQASFPILEHHRPRKYPSLNRGQHPRSMAIFRDVWPASAGWGWRHRGECSDQWSSEGWRHWFCHHPPFLVNTCPQTCPLSRFDENDNAYNDEPSYRDPCDPRHIPICIFPSIPLWSTQFTREYNIIFLTVSYFCLSPKIN